MNVLIEIEHYNELNNMQLIHEMVGWLYSSLSPSVQFYCESDKNWIAPNLWNIMLMLFALVYSSIFMDGSGGVQSRREKKNNNKMQPI